MADEKSTPKKDTSRIELSEAEAPDADVEVQGAEPLSVRQIVDKPKLKPAESVKKSQTSRIDLEDAEAPTYDASVGMGKDATVRVDLTAAMARMKEVEAVKAGEKMSESKSAEKASDAQDDRSSTARISLGGAEVAPTSAEPPRTVRLKRPSSSPRTVVMKKPTSAETPADPASASDESGKGTTSRIEVPEQAVPEGPASGRKTIRIKRGSTPGAKTLTIARPGKATGPTLSAKADSVRDELEAKVAIDEPGPLYGVLSIAAALVLCVLIYALVAQTLAPDLPFPGRIL